MLISLIHHLLSCFDQSFASENQCFIHVIEYIFCSSDLQTFANAFILNDVRIKVHIRMKVFVHEEENHEND